MPEFRKGVAGSEMTEVSTPDISGALSEMKMPARIFFRNT